MENNNKQRLLIEYLISSPDTFALCKSIVKSEYFDPEYRQAVTFVHEYYDKYHTTPKPVQIEGETDLKLKEHVITRDQIDYCTNEIEKFCRSRAIKLAVVQAAALIDSGDTNEIERLVREAVLVSLNRDLGLDYFQNPTERLAKEQLTPQRTPTKWKEFDDLLGGGLARTEILLFSANSGGGKSITLANLGMNYLMQGLNVMYISLELSEEMIAQRFDTMFTDIPSVNRTQNYDKIAQEITFLADQMVMNQSGEMVPMGKLNIKHMPSGTNANAIRAYIKEYYLKHGIKPDLLIVDYLDIMGANEKVSADNISEKDKRATEQLRDILFEHNMFGATASQQNRAAIDAQELNQGHIAGGLTKVNTVDWYVSIILNAMMKSQGVITFQFLKSRSSDAVGKQLTLRWDNGALRIRNMTKDVDTDIAIFQRIPKKQVKASMNDFIDYEDSPGP